MPSPDRPPPPPPTRVEAVIERALFGSRWLLAPLYLGLAVGMLLLLAKFVLSAVDLVMHGLVGSEDHLIVGVLGLIDICLVANLVLMVMVSGYDEFVSRLGLDAHRDRPVWMEGVGFKELKLKLMTSIVAISAIHVLEDFMNAPSLADRDLAWRGGLHLLFIVSAVLLALMDRISHVPLSHVPPGDGH